MRLRLRLRILPSHGIMEDRTFGIRSVIALVVFARTTALVMELAR